MKIEQILRLTQSKLKRKLNSKLKTLNYETIFRDGFLYGIGEVPVLLVAHLDTVHKQPVKTICYSSDGKIMSPEGIGGDDRTGVYMILEIIKELKCHVLFCEDEEIGAVGASKFCEAKIKPDVNFIIELDRTGANDAIFYECDNPDFTRFITSHGFIEDYGSFSDISVIAPYLKISAVNISSGFYYPHTRYEFIDMKVVKVNIERVKEIIKSDDGTKYKYIKAIYTSLMDFGYYELEDSFYEERLLMELSDDDGFILHSDDYIEEAGGYFIDEKLNVYMYCDYGTFVQLRKCEALKPEGTNIQFDEEKAFLEFVEL